ncbi:permease [Pleionea sediminis]|uniref:permease n=1 Tax=Pleionea sediminis TaxID=2569479 RepID=UPI001184E269|nr:permease [Pleionea sediminis]
MSSKHNHCHSASSENESHSEHESSCHGSSSKFDFLLWGSLSGVVILYTTQLSFGNISSLPDWLNQLSSSSFELVNTMWWGLLIGIGVLSVLTKVPREFVMSALGSNKEKSGIFRATLAGVLLDLCSHGILMVGAKLYQRGASLGQVIAFLVASPWNSFSLTLVLIALVGLKWTFLFILLSLLIAIVSGFIFDSLVSKNILPDNPNKFDLPKDFQFWTEAKEQFNDASFNRSFFKSMIIDGIKESRMVMRWVLFGILLASIIRVLFSPESFSSYFGPDLIGLVLTVIAATIIEVCSEGSTPIAADLLNRAHAPGNSFAFLMTGVSTDYTEMMIIRDTTRSWKIALFIPLVTVPQVLCLAWILNTV